MSSGPAYRATILNAIMVNAAALMFATVFSREKTAFSREFHGPGIPLNIDANRGLTMKRCLFPARRRRKAGNIA